MAAVDFSKVYSATYSSVPVYEFKLDGDSVMRRRSDDWINATHILKVAGFDKPARTRILEREVQKGVHEKVQGGYGKYQGTWIPLPEGRMLAERNNIIDKLRPIFDYVAGDRSPPPAPKHTTAASSKPRAPKNTNKRVATEEVVPAPKPHRNMAPPPYHPYEPYEMSQGFDEDESLEQATLESSSMIADEEIMAMSQNGTYSRKRKRGINEAPAISISEQEHILYGDQLLDYFMTVGDAPEATRIPPPQPPANFQVDRAIDDSGNTALHWACAMGDLEIVRDLLRRGANIRALSDQEETPLVRAVLFTNNYEKRTFPPLLELLLDTVSFRDWFGATLFHHIAETTRSKGKWKSSRYYCEVLLDKLRVTFSAEEVDLLLFCQDQNGDTAALIAARNGAFRLVDLLLARCPRAGDLINNKGEAASTIVRRVPPNERDVPLPPSSITMGNDQLDPDIKAPVTSDHLPPSLPQDSSPTTSALMSKIAVIMSEANKKLTASYGSSKATQQDSDDVANPEALYAQLESDRQKIQKQVGMLVAKEAEEESIDTQLDRYEQLKNSYESLLEQIHQARLRERIASTPVPEKGDTGSDQDQLRRTYLMARQLCSAQKARRSAVKDLVQQTADAGVSTKFDVHRKLVALATGLKEEDLDPMAAELAETLEFDRMNGKATGAESPDPEARESATFPTPGPTVSVDA